MPSELQHRAAAELKPVVLCLDDDPVSQKLVQLYLRDEYHVLTCGRLDEAMLHARATRVDYLVADYNLGDGITGVHALESLQQEPGFHPTASVLITANLSTEVEHDARQAGFLRMFEKPLRETFRSYFARTRSQAPLAYAPAVSRSPRWYSSRSTASI